MKVILGFFCSVLANSACVFGFTTGPVSRAVSVSFSKLAVTTDPNSDIAILSDDEVPDFDAMMDEDFGGDFDDDEADDGQEEVRLLTKPHKRWSKLNTNVKQRWKKTRVDQAVQNRKESKQDKRRRLMMFVKKAQQEKKRAARVERKLPFDMRTPLSALAPGVKLVGQVISLTAFGAYVDIGSECDGLLHISQMSREIFVRHPREILTVGDEIEVKIKSLNPAKKKLHLTLLEETEGAIDDGDDDERIPLDDIEIDDELWGEIVRVTDYGAYVELGAAVQGFLHFMDHPLFGDDPGAHPSTYLKRGQRIRSWVADVDQERNRVRLTANRPPHLPGPRREF